MDSPTIVVELQRGVGRLARHCRNEARGTCKDCPVYRVCAQTLAHQVHSLLQVAKNLADNERANRRKLECRLKLAASSQPLASEHGVNLLGQIMMDYGFMKPIEVIDRTLASLRSLIESAGVAPPSA